MSWKSTRCPEFQGDAIDIQLLFADWMDKHESAAIMKRCAENNLQYWTAKAFRELMDALPPDFRNELKAFIRLYHHWFGEYPIGVPRKHKPRSGGMSIMLVTTKGGEVKVRERIVSLSRTKPTADDARNAEYYRERQLQYIKPKHQ